MLWIRKSILFLAFFLSLEKAPSQIVINEIFLTNCSADMVTPQYNYLNWIELYNAGTTTIKGTYYLSDDSLNLKKWMVYISSFLPAKFKVFYFTGLSSATTVDFKPEAEKGSLFLSNTKGIVDKLYYGQQHYNISYGRVPDGSGVFNYLLNPSRGAINNVTTLVNKSNNVISIPAGGFYSGTTSLTLLNTMGQGTIYYTTDGTEPDTSSLKYISPISIAKTTVIRARIMENGKIPGNIFTSTYLVNERKPLMEILSIVTPPKNLFDSKIGIYVAGTNGIEGNCDGKKNWNRDWERSANFELFDKTLTPAFNQMVGLEIAGGCSRSFNPQKSFAVTARNKYGKSRLSYPFFTDRSGSDFNSLYLRVGGNDWGNTLFRDAMTQKLADKFMNLEHQSVEPAVIFINGQYYGIQNIYERSGKDLIEATYGLKETEIQMGEGYATAIEGSVTDYGSLLAYINTNSLAIESNYKHVADELDIDNFIDYYIFQIYISNHDWPGNNSKYWRRIQPKSKWRYILFDTDFGFGLADNGDPGYNMLTLMTTISSDWPNYEWSTRLFRKLIENEEFKRKFISRFYAHITTTFKPNLVIATIDSMAALFATEIPFHNTRWGSPSLSSWNSNVETMRNFARLRPDIMRQHLREVLGAGEDVTLSCHSASKLGYGYISFDNVVTPDTAYSGIFPKNSISNIRFIPAPGYAFEKAICSRNGNEKLSIIKKGDTWKYFDGGPEVDTNWTSLNLNDSAWKSGPAQLGYGDGDEQTIVSFGPDTNNKYITTYFRKTFDFDSLAKYSDWQLALLVDDGAVIYLNGKELMRHNIPDGEVSYNTLANNSDIENTYTSYAIDSKLVRNGSNMLAVEVHQSAVTSSDISFDMELTATKLGISNSKIITEESFVDTLSGNTDYIAYFKEVTPIANLVINEVAAGNSVYADEYGETDDWFELYNNSNEPMSLSGLFVSDSIPNPLKYKIPVINGENITIAPGEYKIIWSDKQLEQGPLHVNFKLKNGNDQLGLSQKVGNKVNILDAVYYNSIVGTKSYGRYPNAYGPFKKLYKATPNAENFDLASDIISIDEKSNFANVYFQQNNKMLQLKLKTEELSSTTELQIFDISGRILLTKTFSGNLHSESLSSFKNGLYLISVKNANGFSTSKIIVH